MKIEINNISMMNDFGERLGRLVYGGCFIALKGSLGLGKTTLTKAIAKGMGIKGVRSPSFSILNIYEGNIPIYHFDFYRLDNSSSYYDLGFDDYFFGEGVSITEWGERVQDYLPKDRLEIEIEYIDEDKRVLYIESLGEDKLYERLKNDLFSGR